jgi:hypothetical protein
MEMSSGKTNTAGVLMMMSGLALTLAGACGSEGRGQPPTEIEARTSAVVEYPNQLLGYNFTEPSTDSNRCVPHAATVLNRMNARGENIGIHYRSAGYTDTDGSDWHAQSIVRLPYYWWDTVHNGQYFVEDIDHPMGTGADDEGHLGVARLDFTGGKSGLAIHSNKTYNDWGNNGADWNTAPNPGDSFVPVNGTSKFHVDPNQNHVGGMSGIGWYVAVSLMQWDYSWLPPWSYIPSGSVPIVKIFNHWFPESPSVTQTFTTWIDQTPIYDTYGNQIGVEPTGNDAVAITKLQDGRYLMVVEKGANLKRLEFYVSTGTSLYTSGAFDKPGYTPGTQPPDATYVDPVTPYPGWTSMNFITDCQTGELYLFGFLSSGSIENKHVVVVQDSATHYTATLGDPPPDEGITAIKSKPMSCQDNAGHNQCALTSSAGTYIDPDGRVIFYVMGGDGDGCLVNGSNGFTTCSGVVTSPWLVHGNGGYGGGGYSASAGYMRGMEFHERHGNYMFNNDCPTLDKAWVELYENPGFNSAPNDLGRNYHVDIADFMSKPTHSLALNSFNNTASSVRWCLPVGYSFTLYEGLNWSGSYINLAGNGYIRALWNFAGRGYGHGTGLLDKTVSSYWFNYDDSDPLHEWGDSDDTL